MIGDINDRPDVLIVCVGGNDMLAGRSVREWAAVLAPVLDAAKNKAGKVMLFSSGQPHRSPVLPRAAPRHRTPHQRADRHEPATVRDARHRLPRPDPYRFWAVEGFHPGTFGYVVMADAIMRLLFDGAKE